MYKFEKLRVWQRSVDLVETIYEFSKALPQEEAYILKNQLKRAVLSVSLNIAEGSGAGSDKEYRRYVLIAKKSLFETIAILKIIQRLYKKDIAEIEEKISEIGKMLTVLSQKLKERS